MEAPERPRRTPLFALAAAILAAAAATAVVSDELGSMGGDSAEYVLLSKALREGVGYRTTWAPGEPAPHVLYPPLWPVMLLPFSGAAPGSFLGAHLLLAGLLGGAVFAFARLLERRGWSPPAAAAAALAPALSIHALRCAGDLLSEIPFLLFAALALLLVEPGGEARVGARRVALAALCAGLAFYARTAAIALVVPLVIALCTDRRTRGPAAWIASAALVAAVGGWFLRGALVGGDATSYGAQLAEGEGGLLARAWGQLVSVYLPGTPAWILPHAGWAWDALGWLLWALAVVGLVCGIARRRTGAVAEGFFLLWLAMQCAWPFRDPRFALPLAFLLVPFAIEGATLLFRRVPEVFALDAGVAASLLALLCVVPNLVGYCTHVFPRAHREAPAIAGGGHRAAGVVDTWLRSDDDFRLLAPPLAAFLHACDVVRMAGPGVGIPEGPVLASNPRVAALLCGRPAVGAPAGASPEALAALAREKGVALVIVDSFRGDGPAAIRAWADARDGTLEPVFAVPGGVRVVRIRR